MRTQNTYSRRAHRVSVFCKGVVHRLGDPYYTLHQSPTQTLYWLNRWIQAGISPNQIARIENCAYLKKNDGVYFSRAISSNEYQSLRRLKMPMHYLIDDDYEAMAKDEALPEKYRQKMERFSRGVLPAICSAKDVRLYAASTALAALHGCEQIDPIWLSPSNKGLARPESGKTIRLAFLSTASHLKDFSILVDQWLPMINEALRRVGKQARVTHYLKSHVGVEQLPEFSNTRWEHRFALPWNIYRRDVPRAGYHAILYPLEDTPVNAARSNSKMKEAGLLGIPVFQDAATVVQWIDRT